MTIMKENITIRANIIFILHLNLSCSFELSFSLIILEMMINQTILFNNIYSMKINVIIMINVKKCKRTQGFALKQGLIDYFNLVNNNVIFLCPQIVVM